MKKVLLNVSNSKILNLKNTLAISVLIALSILSSSCNRDSLGLDSNVISSHSSQIFYVRVSTDTSNEGMTELWTVNEDGTGDKMFKKSAMLSSEPVNGKIAYLRKSDSVFFQTELCIANTDCSDERVLYRYNGDEYIMPVLSPDGTKIAYLASEDQGNPDNKTLRIFHLDPSSTKIVNNYKISDNLSDFSLPSFSKDGNSILFRTGSLFGGDYADTLFLSDAIGSYKKVIDYGSIGLSGMDITPDGKFAVSMKTTISKLDGKTLNQIVKYDLLKDVSTVIWESESVLYTPKISSDGTKIAFLIDYANICTINIDGSNYRKWTNYPTETFNAMLSPNLSWSKDNNKIIFQTTNMVSLSNQIFIGKLNILDLKNGNVRQLASDANIYNAFFVR